MQNATVADHIGRTIAEMLPHVYNQIEPYLQRALSGHPSVNLKARMRCPCGAHDEHLLIVSYQPVRDAADEVIGISISVIDITQLDGSLPKPDTGPGIHVPRLTARQSEVLHLVATGRSAKGIALALDPGIDTVKNHLAEAYRLLGVHNRVEAIRRSGLMVGAPEPRASRRMPPAPTIEPPLPPQLVRF